MRSNGMPKRAIQLLARPRGQTEREYWFGVLEFFPGLSPAQDLATRTIATLTLGLIPSNVSILVLAA